MKRNLLPILLLLTACRSVAVPQDTGRLQIALGAPELRSAVATEAEKRIWNAQFLVFDRQGTLCFWQRTVFPEGTQEYRAELTVPTGRKEVWVITNLTAGLQDIADINALMQRRFLLTENAIVSGADGGVVMVGNASVVIEEAAPATCRIQVRRLLARIHVGSIRNSLPAGRTIGSPSLQLSNIAADRTLDTGSQPRYWCNKLLDQGSDLAAQAPVTGSSIESGTAWNAEARLYAFPNPVTDDTMGGSVFTPRKTRLVFSCTLGDIRYYYPVTLSDLEENTSYRVDLTIQRPGSSDPDLPVENGSFHFTVEPEPWTAPISYSENL